MKKNQKSKIKNQKSKPKFRNLNGFTLIEVILTVVLIGIIMIPIALIAMEYVRSTAYADSLTMAVNLSRREMAVVNNINYNTLSSASFPNYMAYNFDLTRQVDLAPGFGNLLKKVIVTVSPHGSAEKLIEAATYAMNVSFGAGGNARASSFTASGGSFTSSDSLSGIALQNLDVSDYLTIVGVVMTSNSDRTLSSITMGGSLRYSGSIAITGTPVQLPFQNNFAMSPNATYSGGQGGTFTFPGAPVSQSYTVTVAFIFSDGSQSQEYSWDYRAPRR